MDTIFGNNWLWLPVVGNPEAIQIVVIEKEDKSYKLTLENPIVRYVHASDLAKGSYQVKIVESNTVIWKGRFWRELP